MATKQPHRVLVTGSAGFIGRAACRELLARGHFVRGFDRHPSPLVSEAVIGDLTDPAAIGGALEGIDTVAHIGAYPTLGDFVAELLRPNIIGLHYVCEAARQAGVRRLVLTSSVQLVDRSFKPDRPVRVDEARLATNDYALTKVLAEEMGLYYARAHGMSVIVVRPAWLARDQEDIDRIARSEWQQRYNYLSPGDAGRCYACAVESEKPIAPGIATVFAVSRTPPPHRPWLDPTAGREVIGFEAQDTYPAGLEAR